MVCVGAWLNCLYRAYLFRRSVQIYSGTVLTLLFTKRQFLDFFAFVEGSIFGLLSFVTMQSVHDIYRFVHANRRCVRSVAKGN